MTCQGNDAGPHLRVEARHRKGLQINLNIILSPAVNIETLA